MFGIIDQIGAPIEEFYHDNCFRALMDLKFILYEFSCICF